ncbi:MAG: ABC transporter ATP-binding protein [Lachnospiraceae bacterium]|nr:ABC transporter ATP-binding protein [Lachnospiraceae bacterium]
MLTEYDGRAGQTRERYKKKEEKGRNMNEEAAKEEKKWFGTLMSYAKGSGGRLGVSVVLSMISLLAGLIPYYCVYRILDKYIAADLDKAYVLHFSLIALCAYLVKVICFGLSTGISHYVAFNVLEGLRLKVADVFLKAPLGEVYAHSIGEIKSVILWAINISICSTSSIRSFLILP